MGGFLSVPLLSFVLLPSLASYTTTFNILFFYMTWSTLVWSHTPLRVEIWGTAAFRLVFYVVPSVIFFLFDVLTPSAAVVIKAHDEAGLPGGKKRFKLRLKEFKIAVWALGNLSLSIFTQTAIEWFFTRVLHVRSAIKVAVGLPTPWTIGQDIFFAFILREVSHFFVDFTPRLTFT